MLCKTLINNRLLFSFAFSLSFYVLSASGMEFRSKRINDNVVLIAASGLVETGDSERLISLFLTLPRNGTNVVALNSSGGNVVAGEALAAAIQSVKAKVFVGSDSICASACFIVFAASPNRFYVPGARIGVHSAIRGSFETSDSMAVTTAMARSAAALGVPNAIIGKMVSTLPGDMAWLSESDLSAMGAYRLDTPFSDSPPSAASSAPAAPPPAANTPTASLQSTIPNTTSPLSQKSGTPKDEASPSFLQGKIDRTAWEQWFATLSGDTRLGSEYWTKERSKHRPGNCVGTLDFTQGCQTTKQRLALSDVKRKTDPQYWWGWNSL